MRTETGVLYSGDISINKNTCKAYKNEKQIDLSRQEYRLLVYFLENKNHVLSKEQILGHIWDNEGKYVDNNTLSVNISRLRAKIENNVSNSEHIRTVHGVGYIWKE